MTTTATAAVASTAATALTTAARHAHAGASPTTASQTAATTGMASRTAVFAIPVVVMDRAMADRSKPYLPYMAYVTATPTPAPAGTVFATAVLVCVTTSAGRNRSPGNDAIDSHGYVARLSRVSPASSSTQPAGTVRTTRHTSPRSATCGRKPANAVTTTAAVATDAMTRRRADVIGAAPRRRPART